MFGGNSNWRGPVWFPNNGLLVNTLQRYHAVYGDGFTVECPTGSGKRVTLREVSVELARRLAGLSCATPKGGDRVTGGSSAISPTRSGGT